MKQEVADYATKCLTCQRVKIETNDQQGCYSHWTSQNGSGIGIYGFHGRSASDIEEKQRNMSSCGPPHEDGTLYSHTEYLDIGLTG